MSPPPRNSKEAHMGGSDSAVRISVVCDEAPHIQHADHDACKLGGCICPCHRMATGIGNWETR